MAAITSVKVSMDLILDMAAFSVTIEVHEPEDLYKIQGLIDRILADEIVHDK